MRARAREIVSLQLECVENTYGTTENVIIGSEKQTLFLYLAIDEHSRQIFIVQVLTSTIFAF